MTLTQGPPWQTYRVTSRSDGSTTVRIRTGDGLAAKEGSAHGDLLGVRHARAGP
jgi:hypothetical protein